MLKRGDSDFAWFKARSDSIHSSLTSQYSEMAAATVPLNAETSQPQERAEHHLPQKSYADAVADYEGADARAPADAGANGHLQDSSSMGTAGNTNGFPPREIGADKPIENKTDNPSKNTTDESTKNVTTKQLDEDKLVYEKYVDDRGTHLTSVKTDEAYSKGLNHDRETAPLEEEKSKIMQAPRKHDPDRKQEKIQLASGRRAGAGWERSAYAYPIYCTYQELTRVVL